jgi:hypothetical protein
MGVIKMVARFLSIFAALGVFTFLVACNSEGLPEISTPATGTSNGTVGTTVIPEAGTPTNPGGSTPGHSGETNEKHDK